MTGATSSGPRWRSAGPLSFPVLLALTAAAILLVPGGAPGTFSGAAPSDTIPPPPPFTLVNYTSTVDGMNLSYYEWLPEGFSNSTTYPLAVYLHGLGADGSEIFSLTGGLSAIAAAQEFGFILISINTRTLNGFYVNSPYTGPQQQDVLDAINSEKSLHRVSEVYLFGSSMGADGSWSIAGNVPGLVAGIGSIAGCPDSYAGVYWHYLAVPYGYLDYLNTTGGQGPNTTYFQAQTYYLSAARYYPQNYSHILLYGAQGGDDQECPNNPDVFGYQQANNTFLNATCLVVSQWDQPANCQTPFANLSLANPGEYNWRFVYSPNGNHTLNELNGSDLFSFWLGDEPTGLVCSPDQGDTPVECPVEPVRFTETGLNSGIWNVTIDGTTHAASVGTPIDFGLDQGWHSYQVGLVPGYAPIAPGILLVGGDPLQIDLTYVRPAYDLNFTETGLPEGTNWSVTVGTATIVSAGSTIEFPEPGGTYSYSVLAIPGYEASPWSGTVPVPDENVSVPIAWSQVAYTVWFNESALPFGTPWELSFQDGTVYLNSSLSGSSTSFDVPNGTYPFSVTGPAAYSADPPGGQVTVDGASEAIAIDFVVANGTVEGTITPTGAIVWIDGTGLPVDDGRFLANETPGTYAIRVTAGGYSPYFTNVTVRSREVTWLNTSLAPVGGSSATALSTYLPYAVGAGLLVVAAVAVVLLRRRSARPPPRPPARAPDPRAVE
jgi:poly(3-hydroxybutyrate) depolymerase